MELIRCDQCKTEIRSEHRHWVCSVAGSLRTVYDDGIDLHFCSEVCARDWYAERAATLERRRRVGIPE